jgi:hypothetical protein
VAYTTCKKKFKAQRQFMDYPYQWSKPLYKTLGIVNDQYLSVDYTTNIPLNRAIAIIFTTSSLELSFHKSKKTHLLILFDSY